MMRKTMPKKLRLLEIQVQMEARRTSAPKGKLKNRKNLNQIQNPNQIVPLKSNHKDKNRKPLS